MNIQELKAKIVEANILYREGTPIMDDSDFDSLLEEFEKQVSEAEYSNFRNSLHETTGKVRHPYVMGSLDKLKIQEPETIIAFIRKNIKTKLNVSAKVDGISCRLHYENGMLESASTRGDGSFGENLTDKIKYVQKIPNKIAYEHPIDIRGELVILKEDFAGMINFSNPRNACAGIMNRKVTSKEFDVCDIGKVSFIPYTILGDKFTKSEQFDFLEKNGFSASWHRSFSLDEFSSDEALVNALFEYATQELPYEIDGAVISDDAYVNEPKYRPDAQAAVKANTLCAVSRLIDVSWEGPSKNGMFVPVGIIDPVELGGAMIGRVTCNNLDFIDDMGLKYGSVVKIVKSGDIIPAIASVIDTDENCRRIDAISVCTCCGEALIRDGVNMRCINPECVDQKIYRMESFIKKLGVMNASFKTLRAFGITSVDKLLSFKPNAGKKSETKFETELRTKMFNRSPVDIFCMMDIKDVGETLQKKIVEFYRWDNIMSRNIDTTNGLPAGIGQITLDKFLAAYGENMDSLRKIMSDVRYAYVESSVKTVKAVVGSVCFTGSLNTMSRSEASKMAADAGYEVKSGVSKGLTYLVTNDKTSGSSKNVKAAKLGTKIIDETEFIKLVSNQVESDIMDF